MKHWGIDLGGTKTEITVIEDGSPLVRKRTSTNAERGYEAILATIKLLVDETASILDSKPASIGFATPGSVTPSTGLLKNSNTVALNGKPLAEDLRRTLGAEVLIANDANCFALAEARWGAGRGLESGEVLVGLIVGTGVGSGIVVDDEVLSGANGNAGEWGHNVLEVDGLHCYCGRRGCVETVISGPALERFYEGLTGRRISLDEIVGRIYTDDAAKATVQRLTSKFGEAIAGVINILDPKVIVVGGGVGNIPSLYDKWSDAALPFVFNGIGESIQTTLVKPILGDSAGVFGAAALTGRFELREF